MKPGASFVATFCHSEFPSPHVYTPLPLQLCDHIPASPPCFSKSGYFFGFFLHRAKSAHLIIQNNSAEGPELWTQFCRRPNLKHRETTTWFCEACSACCRDYFGGRGHCVKMIVSEEFLKKHWAELILLYTLRVSGRNRRSAFRSLWQGSGAPMYICWLHLLKWKKCK